MQEIRAELYGGLDDTEDVVSAEAGAAHEVIRIDPDPQVETTPEVSHDVTHKDAKHHHPSVLIPILTVLVKVSTAFAPLQSSAGGLLEVVKVVEVRHSAIYI